MLDREGHAVDQVVATFFEAPRSYTAEDVVEISCHGSPVVLRHAVERALEAGARLAEPGEFTLRAFLNGRIDLPQAEAVRDLIEATTLYQARIAAQQAGRLGLAPHRAAQGAAAGADRAARSRHRFRRGRCQRGSGRRDPAPPRARPRRRSRNWPPASSTAAWCAPGLTLAIVGRPNVGKSSLFNRLLEQDRAIVTDIPGTTRDLVSETASIGGIPVKLYDTAGIREAPELVESLGIERSYQAMADADLTLVVVDLSAARCDAEDRGPDRARRSRRAATWWSATSATCARRRRARPALLPSPPSPAKASRSLREAILERGRARRRVRAGDRLHHQPAPRAAAARIGGVPGKSARRRCEAAIPHEMLLLDLYAALRPIDAITGATTADDILNRIFSHVLHREVTLFPCVILPTFHARKGICAAIGACYSVSAFECFASPAECL